MKRPLTLVLFMILFSLLAACEPGRSGDPGQTPTVFPVTPIPGRWIEVNLAGQTVVLHDGETLVNSLTMSSGVGGDPNTTTYPGEFSIQMMYRGPEETVPGVYVENIVIFDLEHGNGFHSMPMDAEGNILDSTQGKPATAGCVRMADSESLFDFARVGMKVIVH
jgi:lipoprotein-anchoring transpeptidase ErfK/SrfK